MTIDDYIFQLSYMNTAKRMGPPAPHKAVMLLSVIDLVEAGIIRIPSFEHTASLEEKFHEIWKRYVGISLFFKPVPATPFYHLCNEPFWRLNAADGTPVEKLPTTPSLGYLRNNGIRAAIDKDLFELMKQSDCRARMRTLLISTYLTHQKIGIRKTLPMVLGFVAARLCV